MATKFIALFKKIISFLLMSIVVSHLSQLCLEESDFFGVTLLLWSEKRFAP